MKKLTPYESKNIIDALMSLQDWEQYHNNEEKLFFGAAYGMQKAFVRKVDAENKSVEVENLKADDIDEDDLPF